MYRTCDTDNESHENDIKLKTFNKNTVFQISYVKIRIEIYPVDGFLESVLQLESDEYKRHNVILYLMVCSSPLSL